MEKKPYRIVAVLSGEEGRALDRGAIKAGLSRSAFIRFLIRQAGGLEREAEVPDECRWKWRKDRRNFRNVE